jgi:hypothetical protein
MTFPLAAILLAAAAAVPASQDQPNLTSGDTVRLRTADAGSRRLTAIVVEVQPDALLVRTAPDAPARRIPLADLQRLEVARGRHGHVLQGAAIGFLPGFIFGAYAGNALGCDDQGPNCTDVGAALGVGALLGGITAVAGGLVGLAVRSDRWQELPLSSTRSTRLGAALTPVRGGLGARVVVSF